MKRSSGARLCATAAVGALSLALVTGCGSSDEGSKDSGGSKGSSSSSAAASDAKALTTAELKKLLLAQGELKGYKVGSGEETAASSKSAVKVDKAECAPMAWATNGLPPGDTDANATNSLTEDKASDAPTSLEDVSEADIEGAFNVTITYVGLSSYEGDGAEKTIKTLSDGVTACAGGYGFTTDGETSKVTKVAAEKGSGQGDESVAFIQEVDVEGQTISAHTEVVRKGNTLATFFTMDLAALAKGGEMSDVPAAVIDAQVAKLK
ncbi:hypothetical protein ACK389_32635 [Streptomyces antibioticus]|uniref:Lipoprotein n=1 Tax=Streptomyces antibioticus TaxID=1890 RepID=A0AAE6YAW8_STRAT|nr:hypothetical protein [Streptomyces antibioticus]MCX5171148.1 hypothetical protein [Streptomyces antibioticus]OOQ49371.1 hypothetical protein AFM16_24305 [Streptomyces antibioticus]QIT46333.1 hypothetical protein HCX60_24730 [Streptomyces antibioticus]